MPPVRAESINDEHTYTVEQRRSGPLGPVLSEILVEQVLDRPDARAPVRALHGSTPAVSVTVSARAIEIGAGPLAYESLHDVAALAIACFLDQGFVAVIRPQHGPTFLYPLPSLDEALDDVARFCRHLDEEQLRGRVVACAERFRLSVERSPSMRDLLIDLRLGEGTIAGSHPFVGRLLPASAWRPA